MKGIVIAMLVMNPAMVVKHLDPSNASVAKTPMPAPTIACSVNPYTVKTKMAIAN